MRFVVSLGESAQQHLAALIIQIQPSPRRQPEMVIDQIHRKRIFGHNAQAPQPAAIRQIFYAALGYQINIDLMGVTKARRFLPVFTQRFCFQQCAQRNRRKIKQGNLIEGNQITMCKAVGGTASAYLSNQHLQLAQKKRTNNNNFQIFKHGLCPG